MPSPDPASFEEHLTAIRQAALAAADAAATVVANLRLDGNVLGVGPHRIRLTRFSRVVLVAFGKAAPSMARAAAAILGDRLTAGVATIPTTLLEVTVSGSRSGSRGLGREQARVPAASRSDALGEVLKRITFQPAGHPLPDEGSLAAGGAAADLLKTLGPDDLLLALVSGGGSAMIELPLPGISLADLQEMTALLLRCGAPIQAFNSVRQALSQIKCGGLARLASPARTVALILSDVVGNRLSSIASAPTVLRRPDPARARQILRDSGIWERTPPSVRAALSASTSNRRTSTSKHAPRPVNLLVGTNRQVVEAAARRAESLGFPPRILSTRMQGEAQQVGRAFAERLLRAPRPACLLAGGETTVTVKGRGRGGRNQELALAAAIVLEGMPGLAVMAFATDGVDGPTDAAGAIVSGETLRLHRRRRWDPTAALVDNDAYPLLQAARALVFTGPTGTNLSDLVVGLAYP